VADLLEAGVEALRQHVHVVVQGLGGGMERRIGHHHGSREIIGQRNPVQPPRRVVEGAGAVDDRINAGAAFGKPDLKRELEGAAGAVDQFGDQQLPAVAVEPAQRLAHHVDRHDPGDDRMFSRNRPLSAANNSSAETLNSSRRFSAACSSSGK